MRATHSIIQSNNSPQNRLWGHSISGDLPIILLCVRDFANIDFVRKIIQAHTYYRAKGLHVDIIIWNEEHGSYRNSLNELLQGMISGEGNNINSNKFGKILIKSADQLSVEDNILIQSVARVILYDNKGSIANQLNSIIPKEAYPLFTPKKIPNYRKPLSD